MCHERRGTWKRRRRKPSFSPSEMALRVASWFATVSRTRPHHTVKMSAATISIKPTVTQVSVARIWLSLEPGDGPVRRMSHRLHRRARPLGPFQPRAHPSHPPLSAGDAPVRAHGLQVPEGRARVRQGRHHRAECVHRLATVRRACLRRIFGDRVIGFWSSPERHVAIFPPSPRRGLRAARPRPSARSRRRRRRRSPL